MTRVTAATFWATRMTHGGIRGSSSTQLVDHQAGCGNQNEHGDPQPDGLTNDEVKMHEEKDDDECDGADEVAQRLGTDPGQPLQPSAEPVYVNRRRAVDDHVGRGTDNRLGSEVLSHRSASRSYCKHRKAPPNRRPRTTSRHERLDALIRTSLCQRGRSRYRRPAPPSSTRRRHLPSVRPTPSSIFTDVVRAEEILWAISTALGRAEDPWTDHQELVAAQPTNVVAVSQGALDLVCRGHKKSVARGMTELRRSPP